MDAEFERVGGAKCAWRIKGIDCTSVHKTVPAWLFLMIHGIGITYDARACLIKDIIEENSK